MFAIGNTKGSFRLYMPGGYYCIDSAYQSIEFDLLAANVSDTVQKVLSYTCESIEKRIIN